MTTSTNIYAVLAIAALQVACAQTPPNTAMEPAPSLPVQPVVQPEVPAAPAASGAPTAPDKAEGAQPRMLPGSGQILAPSRPVQPIVGSPLTFNFEEAPIAEVVRTIVSDVLKAPYVLHPPLSGTVTLTTRTPIEPDQAVFLLESALQANGLGLVRDARGTYHVGRLDTLKALGLGSVGQAGAGAPLPPGYGAIIVPLRYIGAAEMATILRSMAPPDAIVRVDGVRNLLVLRGTRVQAEGWLDLVSTFDVNLLQGMSVGLFPLKHATIKEVETALRLVSGSPAAQAGSATGAGGARSLLAPTGAAESTAALGEGNPLFGALRIMPVDRLNSILVVTPHAAYLEEARRWIEKLDQPGGGGAEPQLHIYKVQNGNSRHLAGVLSGIFGGTPTGGAAASGNASSGVAPALGQVAAGTLASPFGGSTMGRAANAGLGASAGAAAGTFGAMNRTAQSGQGAQTSMAADLGGIRVMSDDLNNSVLVWSTRAEFEKIQSTLKRLDLPPTQVLIEASIIEVTLGDDLKYGLQWAFTDSHRGGAGSGLVGLAPSVAGGFSYTLKDSLGNMRVTLKALAEKSLIKVISSPSLMVLDNQTATIAVGTQQPIRTGETTNVSTSGTPVTTTTYQYKDTGVQLMVQPSVNSGDLVTMDISQSVTDVGDEDTVTGQRAFLQRQISSKVAVRTGEAIVLGGLIKDNATTSSSGVPLLSSLPVVGGLFGSTTNNSGRTELLVVITPKVVRTDPQIREVSQELRDRLKGLKVLDR